MSVKAAALTDFVAFRTRQVFSGTSSGILRCDHCGRGAYLSEGLTCKGCGGPLPVEESTPALFVNSNEVFTRPLGISALIPVTPPKRDPWADFLAGMAGVAAAIVGR